MQAAMEVVRAQLHDHIKVSDRDREEIKKRLDHVEDGLIDVGGQLIRIHTTIKISAWAIGLLVAFFGCIEHYDKIAAVFQK